MDVCVDLTSPVDSESVGADRSAVGLARFDSVRSIPAWRVVVRPAVDGDSERRPVVDFPGGGRIPERNRLLPSLPTEPDSASR